MIDKVLFEDTYSSICLKNTCVIVCFIAIYF
nr:MAG TPA: hypothetical protein [Caudoviricetes sp.]